MIVLLSTIIIGCKNKKMKDPIGCDAIEVDSNYRESIISEKSICILNENINLLGGIHSFDFIDEDNFVVSTVNPSSIFIYNINGEQIREINKVGSGTNEYITPSVVRVYDNKIYVWCSMQLKLIVYDLMGNALNEYIFFDKSINHFIPFKSHVVMYFTGGYRNKFIKVYDLKEGKMVYETGAVTNEHIMLTLKDISGGIAVSNSDIYYCSPDKISIGLINTINFTNSHIVDVKDKEFRVNPVVEEPLNIINGDRNSAVDYLLNNSIVTGVFSTERFLVIKAEVGKYIKQKDHHLDISNRHNKFYVFDKQTLDLIHVSKTKMGMSHNNSLYAVNKDHIYYIKEDINKEDMRFELVEMNFNLE
jgi:hypothetical protein